MNAVFFSAERLPVVPHQHLGPQDGVILGQRVPALALHPRLHAAREGVKHSRLVNDADQGVTVAAQDAVGRPQVQAVLPGLLQLRAVVARLREQPGIISIAQPAGHRRVRPHLAAIDVVRRDLAERRQRPLVPVDPERREEDLESEVRVHRRRDMRQHVHVPVDELGDATAVVQRPATAASADVERSSGKAKVLLHVDEQQMDVLLVGGGGGDPVGAAPLGRIGEEPLLIGGVFVRPRRSGGRIRRATEVDSAWTLP